MAASRLSAGRPTKVHDNLVFIKQALPSLDYLTCQRTGNVNEYALSRSPDRSCAWSLDDAEGLNVIRQAIVRSDSLLVVY